MGQWKHRLSNVNPTTRTATCSTCGLVEVKTKQRGASWRCKVANSAEIKRRRLRQKQQGTIWIRKRPTKPCPICGVEETLVWDHNHATGKFRGWICKLCNVGLGMFKDNTEALRKAILYLETAKATL